MPSLVPPSPSRDEEFFWQGVAEDKLLIARCASCFKLQHPPSPMCPVCGSTEWDTVESSGRGTVHSWIVSHHPTRPDDAPRIVALVDLEEGTRLVTNLVDVDPSAVSNNMVVTVTFLELNGVKLPQFRPATTPAGAVGSAGAVA
jgi:uncharacterized OB-fold protein